MNAPSPNPIPSPLVPQGSIPPKNTSRSGRVLLIALTVFLLHVAGLGVVLMQGCQKDAKTASTSETNNAALSYAPIPETNSSSYYSAASNLPPAVSYSPTNSAMAGLPTNFIPAPPAGSLMEPPTNIAPAATAETGTLTDYNVAQGDTLGKIAQRHHITLTALKKANPGVDPVKLKAGQVLKIPSVPLPALGAASGGATTTAANAPAGAAPSAAVVTSGTYKVKAGDNLTKIARAHGVTVAQIRTANKLPTMQVKVGQVLKIPARSTAAAPAAATSQH